MGIPLRVLVLEDSKLDFELLLHEFHRGGYETESIRVQTEEGMRAALEQDAWDIIIADFSMPQFNAMDALKIYHELKLDLPVIIVSGTVGEEVAVEAMKAGAHDYFMKDKLVRFCPAVKRELKEAEVRWGRKRAEESLRESEERYRIITENMSDTVWLMDMNLKTTYISPSVFRARGFTMEELQALPLEKNFSPASMQIVAQVMAEELTPEKLGQKDLKLERTLELEFCRKDGSFFWSEISITLIRDREGNPAGIVGVGRDITERKQLEDQLHQAIKMEAIGRLAGGVAHDLNNALTPIMGISEILLKELGPGHPIYEDIQEIKESGERCVSLTRQLLAFGRRQPLDMKVLNINDAVINIEKLLARVIGEDIGLVQFLDPELGNVKADVGQLEQIIVNLAVNARDAMPDGGKLTIETKNVTLDEEYSNNHVSTAPGPYVMLAVSDNGTGMDAETRAHIFEPFFTTKEIGKGTGLGLSTVYGIVKQSGGNIGVYSEPGKGTTFKIYLPRVEEEAEETRARKRVSAISYRGSETILLVEDEDSVRKVAKRILEEQGYQILEAGNSEQALKLSESYKRPIHIIITDVVMPGMSGKEMSERLLISRPGIKILFVSGYTDNAIVHHGVLEKGTNFLQKPFTVESLTAKVRTVLDEGQ
jgi:two-component system cell cycle sensor histidine kinase/response regulator CckA